MSSKHLESSWGTAFQGDVVSRVGTGVGLNFSVLKFGSWGVLLSLSVFYTRSVRRFMKFTQKCDYYIHDSNRDKVSILLTPYPVDSLDGSSVGQFRYRS